MGPVRAALAAQIGARRGSPGRPKQVGGILIDRNGDGLTRDLAIPAGGGESDGIGAAGDTGDRGGPVEAAAAIKVIGKHRPARQARGGQGQGRRAIRVGGADNKAQGSARCHRPVADRRQDRWLVHRWRGRHQRCRGQGDISAPGVNGVDGIAHREGGRAASAEIEGDDLIQGPGGRVDQGDIR